MVTASKTPQVFQGGTNVPRKRKRKPKNEYKRTCLQRLFKKAVAAAHARPVQRAEAEAELAAYLEACDWERTLASYREDFRAASVAASDPTVLDWVDKEPDWTDVHVAS